MPPESTNKEVDAAIPGSGWKAVAWAVAIIWLLALPYPLANLWFGGSAISSYPLVVDVLDGSFGYLLIYSIMLFLRFLWHKWSKPGISRQVDVDFLVSLVTLTTLLGPILTIPDAVFRNTLRGSSIDLASAWLATLLFSPFIFAAAVGIARICDEIPFLRNGSWRSVTASVLASALVALIIHGALRADYILSNG